MNPTDITKEIESYLADTIPEENESVRRTRFAMLLKSLFSDQEKFLRDFVGGIETSLKTTMLKGRADDLFGNIIVEFKQNLSKGIDDAKDQLRRYTAINWTNEPVKQRRPYICIATDCIRFIAFTPKLKDPKQEKVAEDDVILQQIEVMDWRKIEPPYWEILHWFDRFFFRQQVLIPTGLEVVREFGLSSHAFQTVSNQLLKFWRTLKTENAFDVVYQSWAKYLRIVYGSDLTDDTLFIRHTYLAILAKLMSWKRIMPGAELPEKSDIVKILGGSWFREYGIHNFLEEDFFSWVARDNVADTGVDVAKKLFSLLANYDLSQLSEDVLKSLYQELVDPETRHDLGEYYTPDWLANMLVKHLLNEDIHAKCLDPSCGSGTFLYFEIREKIRQLGESEETLDHILDSVYGCDIHPLAVITAKTNYILALGSMIRTRRNIVKIPVYLTDTIKLPEHAELKIGKIISYSFELEDFPIEIPEKLIEEDRIYDRAIELAGEFAEFRKGEVIDEEDFIRFLNARKFPLASDKQLVQKLKNISYVLKSFLEDDRDTIWKFILKNSYKPLIFRNKFDFIIGNPPWISFRYMVPEYQKFLRKQIKEKYKLLTGHGELITQMEVATLFLARTADLYLKRNKGSVALVMPRSLFTADQHHNLRKMDFKLPESSTNGDKIIWREIWDFEDVEPLFNVPTCVIIGDKRKSTAKESAEARKKDFSINGKKFSGKLSKKNASLEEVEQPQESDRFLPGFELPPELTIEDVQFYLNEIGDRSFWSTKISVFTEEPSYYKDKFLNGATIYPRSFWFVKIITSQIGFNPQLPLLQTADRAARYAKKDYKGLIIRGNVEPEFLYATLLASDLLPFGHLEYRLIVLPVLPKGESYVLIDETDIRSLNYPNLENWIENVEKAWTKRRSSKSERMSAVESLNYWNKLTDQNPKIKYWVLYNTSGTYLASSVVFREKIEFDIEGQLIKASGFVAETVTYFYETNNLNEAYYLSSMLNAPIIDKLIKPMQARGLWGPRHIHKKVLELPIPKFEPENEKHQQLAKIGEICHQKVEQWIENKGMGKVKSIGKMRSMVREMLAAELEQINEIVKEIIR